MALEDRIVITGIGLTAPNGNNLADFRKSMIDGVSGITKTQIRYMGEQAAGLCDFDERKYHSKKARRRGTRAGSIAIYCANEALNDAGIEKEALEKDRCGVFIGITEHGNVETENEIYELHQNDLDTKLWTPHHNPRTVANNPAGEITLNLGITGPHYTIGSACAGGNAGIIQGVQQLRLGEIDVAIAGGISESPQTFGIFAGFGAQGALGYDSEDVTKSIRPMDKNRQGTVISEGGCLYILERYESAKARGAKIYGEIIGYALNSDATDYVNPFTQRQAECMRLALKRAGISEEDVDIVNMHATGTGAGDISEAAAINMLFSQCEKTYVNFSKGHIGHSMGAAGALELAGNLPAFEDGIVHLGLNVDEIDPECEMRNLVIKESKYVGDINIILNNSFGMLGINSTVIVKKLKK